MVRAVLIALVSALALPLPMPVRAQSYPAMPIRLVVGQTPGGHIDLIGRIVGRKLAEILKQPVVIENRGGAGGTLAAETVARAPRDGYTLLLGGSSNLAIAVALGGEVRYDPIRDFVPIGSVAIVPYALAVRPGVPVTTFAQLIDYARAHPGRLTYGSSGMGSTSNLAMEWIKSSAGVDIVHIPYRGMTPAVMDALSGEIDIVATDLSALAAHAKAGTLRILGAAGAQRAGAAPDLPTIAEQGIPGFAVEPWYGLLAPADTPPEIVSMLAGALHEALRAPEVKQRFAELGYDSIVDTPAQFGALIRSDIKRYAAIVKAAGIKPAP